MVIGPEQYRRPVAASGLLRRNAGVAVGTALSRLTGLARVVMIGIVLGGDELADAYVSANNAPNAVYELLIGGVLSAGLVPLLTELRVREDRRGVDAVITVGVLASGVLALLAVVAAPAIFAVLTLNAADGIDVAQFRAAGTSLARILLVQVAFYGLIALGSALLHARRRFFAAAVAPVLANVITVAAFGALWVLRPAGGWRIDQVLDGDLLRWSLGGGATVGIAASALVIFGAAQRGDDRVSWNLDPRHPAVRRLVDLSVWTLGYVAANQITLVIVQNLTEPGSGGRFAYSQAYIFFVLPHGLLAVSIATTFAPELAEAFTRQTSAAFASTLSLGIRSTIWLTAPSGVGLFVLRRPLVGLLLGYGALGPDDVELVADVLGGFALGLPAMSAYLFVLRGFYARLDTRTPFYLNVGECALNVVVGFALVGRFGVPGLAASFSIAYAVSAVVAGAVLVRRCPGFATAAVIRSAGVSLAASAISGVVVWRVLGAVGPDRSGVDAAVPVVVGVTVGAMAYAAAMAALAGDERRQISAALRRRLARRREGDPTGG